MTHLFLSQQVGSTSSQFKIVEYLKTMHHLTFNEQIAFESESNLIWFMTARSERDKELIQDIFEDIRQTRYERHDSETLTVEFSEIVNVIPRQLSLIKYMLNHLDIPYTRRAMTQGRITTHRIQTETPEDMLSILSWLETLPLMALINM